MTPAPGLPDSTDAARARRHVWLFSAATFFYWTALYLYVPILSVYAKSLGASLSMVGIIVAAYAIPQVLFRIPLGILFDAVRRRKSLIAAGILMTSAGALGLGLAPGLWTLFGARIVTGVGAAAWVAFAVYFAAYYPESAAPRAIGVINFVQGAALVAATYGGGLVAQKLGYSSAFFGAAVLGLVALAAHLAAREPAVAERARPISRAELAAVARHWPLIIASLMGVLSQFANWAGLFGFVPVYADRIGAGSSDLGLITMVSLAASALASLLTIRLVRAAGPLVSIVLGALLLGGTMVFVPAMRSLPSLTVLMFVNGLGRGLLQTLLMSLSVQSIPQPLRATAMGVYQAVYAVGMLSGPLVTGFLADALGLDPAFYVAAGGCLVLAAMAFLPPLRTPSATAGPAPR